MQSVGLEDYLLIGEAILGISAESLKHATKLSLAESALHAPFASFGGQDFYPEPPTRPPSSARGSSGTTRCPTATSASP
jgi:hypothetical protein